MFKDKDSCIFARNIGNKYGKKIFDKSLDVDKSMKKNMVKKY